MTRQRSGSIINISSVAGQDANPTNCTYGSSKSAINSFSKILASEIGRLGIRVNVVAPGPTDTDMIERVKAKVGDSMLDRCAMERLAKPDEIAETVVFLASDKASFINGQIDRADGVQNSGYWQSGTDERKCKKKNYLFGGLLMEWS